jgi:BolA family transcriptional regulator, general stress-responsive regulator
MESMLRVAETIERKLRQALSPSALTVIDESHLHQGHAGHRPGGESHFRVQLEAAAFVGQNRVARQRMVYRILDEELKGPVHALALEARAPGE